MTLARPPAGWDERLREAAETLARQVRAWVDQQEEYQQIHDPKPLAVQWRPAPVADVDHRANVYRGGPAADAGVTDIAEFYRRVPTGRLVILGAKGAGKTVLAQRLVRAVLSAREPDGPVPVVIGLNSWDPRKSTLRRWIVDRMLRDFNGLDTPIGAGNLAEALVDGGRIVPVLDGFDEVTPGVHAEALRDLNNVAMPLVLTSRADEYRGARETAGPLRAAEAVILEDLTDEELKDYLPRTTASEADDRWAPVVERLGDSPVGAALRTPLMVSLASNIYGRRSGRDPSVLLDAVRFPTVEAVETHLLEAFVPHLYGRPAGEVATPPVWETRGPYWLGQLASRQPAGDSGIAWWTFGDLIPRPQRMAALVIPALSVGSVTGGLAFGGSGAAAGGAALAVLAAVVACTRGPIPERLEPRVSGRAKYALALLLGGLAGGAAVGVLSRPAVVAWGWWTLPFTGALGTTVGSLSTAMVRRRESSGPVKAWRLELGLGTMGGFSGGAVVGLVCWTAQRPVAVGYPVWIAYCCLLGLSFAIAAAFSAAPQQERSVTPVELLRANRRMALLLTLSVGLAYGLALGALIGPARGMPIGLVVGLAQGIGATAWGRWAILARAWLPLTGRLPWAVWAFLDNAHKRGVLRQAGAVYQFRHGRLQRSLARGAAGAASADRPRP